MLTEIERALSPYGLILRGGFRPAPHEHGLEDVATVLLVGNAGSAMWEVFSADIDGMPNPLDRWTRRVVDAIAAEFGAGALYPFDRPHLPFQRWAARAEAVHQSPIGVLIHPQYGLWHAYRAALTFADRVPLLPRSDAPSPCVSCSGKPCLSACPVHSFDGTTYDVPACAGHITKTDANCLEIGCHARNACPIGSDWRYPESQIRFHTRAFAQSAQRTTSRLHPDTEASGRPNP